MRRTDVIAETQKYTSRHVYKSHVQKIRELAVRYNMTQEEVLNAALAFGLEVLEVEWETREDVD